MYAIDIRDKIKSVLGENGNTYVGWYNTKHGTTLSTEDDWSSVLVSWCAREVGIPESIIPDTMSSDILMAHYKELGLWKDYDDKYAPPTGALIFIKKRSNGEMARVGIVDYSAMRDDGLLMINTYAGANKYRDISAVYHGGSVVTKMYYSGSTIIEGYALPDYESKSDTEDTSSDRVGYQSTEDEEEAGSLGERDGSSPFPTHIFQEYENLPSLDAQPYYAFVDLYIGGHAFPNIPPQYLISLSVDNILLNGSSNVTLVLYDKYSDEIEEVLYRGSTIHEGNAYIRYGHTTGRESRILPFTITDYDLDIEGEGSILTIRGTTQSVVGANLEGTGIFTAGTTPSDAVKTICTRLGLAFTDETIHTARQLVGSDGEPVSFNLIREEDYIKYIKTELCPRAIRESDGVGGYQFYIDDSQTPNVAHFHPLEVNQKALRTYVYQKGVNSNVVSLSITNNFISSGVGISGLASDLEASQIDPITNEEVVQKRTITEVHRNVTGEYTHKKSGQSTQMVETGAMSYAETEANLEYRLTHTNPKTVDMTVVGDPTLSYAGYVRLIILTRKNNLHHTSGIYTISNLSMTIQDGIMLSTMHLFSNDSLMMDGVEMVKYKSLYK